jgi:hypothetical protein
VYNSVRVRRTGVLGADFLPFAAVKALNNRTLIIVFLEVRRTADRSQVLYTGVVCEAAGRIFRLRVFAATKSYYSKLEYLYKYF